MSEIAWNIIPRIVDAKMHTIVEKRNTEGPMQFTSSSLGRAKNLLCLAIECAISAEIGLCEDRLFFCGRLLTWSGVLALILYISGITTRLGRLGDLGDGVLRQLSQRWLDMNRRFQVFEFEKGGAA